MFDVTKNKSDKQFSTTQEEDNLLQEGEEEGESIYDVNDAYGFDEDE